MWRRFLLAFAITGSAALAGVATLILIADPLGISPVGLDHTSGLALEDRRFAAPGLIRSGKFDSFLVGSSTIHSVDPVWAEETFGGSFATLAIHGGTPHEMSEIIKLIGRNAKSVRRVIIGVDAGRWCKPEGYPRYNPNVDFPDWLYDDSRLDDVPTLFNLATLRAALDQLSILFGLKAPHLPENGYRNQLIETKWNAEKARSKLYGGHGIAELDSDEIGDTTAAAADAGNFPDLALLRAALASLPPKAQVIVAIMPSHRSALAKAGEGIEACKRELGEVVAAAHGTAVDFRIASAWTRADDNFWDRNHIRLGLARALMVRLGEAAKLRRDADDGVYRLLTAPTATHSAAK